MEYKKAKIYHQIKGITQEQMAKILNMAVSTYSFKLNGKGDFYLREAKLMADTFGTTIDDLFFSNEVSKTDICVLSKDTQK